MMCLRSCGFGQRPNFLRIKGMLTRPLLRHRRAWCRTNERPPAARGVTPHSRMDMLLRAKITDSIIVSLSTASEQIIIQFNSMISLSQAFQIPPSQNKPVSSMFTKLLPLILVAHGLTILSPSQFSGHVFSPITNSLIGPQNRSRVNVSGSVIFAEMNECRKFGFDADQKIVFLFNVATPKLIDELESIFLCL